MGLRVRPTATPGTKAGGVGRRPRREGMEYMEINPLYIPGDKMVADAFTKYLTRK